MAQMTVRNGPTVPCTDVSVINGPSVTIDNRPADVYTIGQYVQDKKQIYDALGRRKNNDKART